jgi:CDP-paratose 2-epimerase
MSKEQTIIISGSGGMVGSACAMYFAERGWNIIGIDNNMRKVFFGKAGDTSSTTKKLKKEIPSKFGVKFRHYDADISNYEELAMVFEDISQKGVEICAIIHTAAQCSHDKAKDIPILDFAVNANGTLNMLEFYRKYFPDAHFIFTSTNKVYGDLPNNLTLVENHEDRRYELSYAYDTGKYFPGVSWNGVSESFSIDNSTHSLFGVSKAAADLMVQEYGRYFGLKTSVFRGGCLVGPNHQGVELHGYLSYLTKCILTEKQYTIYGRGGYTVRDNIHSHDICALFEQVISVGCAPGSVFNLGGERRNSSSMLQAIFMIESASGKTANILFSDAARIGDHKWYISDMTKARKAFPMWAPKYSLQNIIEGLVAEYSSAVSS